MSAMRKSLLIAAAILPLAACASVTEAISGPSLAPMGYPTALVPQEQPILASVRGDNPGAASANSLWRVGARTFFADQRAGRVGDILTVQISINDNATTTNTSSSSRTSSASAGIPSLLGMESSIGRLLPPGNDVVPSSLVSTNSNSTNEGQGAISRSEQINMTIAAVVTAVLPNGNMVIQGTQEVRTNNELRHLTISGIVRPEDISAANTIRSSQIAEARINYGGRGDISRVQKTPAGQSLVEKFMPF
jgi:flagellar L-ring protein precursor FlgH